MQTLELKNDRFDNQRIYAVMCFPEDGQTRKAYLLMLQDQGKIPRIDVSSESGRWNMPSWPAMHSMAVAATRSGYIAGEYVLLYAHIAIGDRNRASGRRVAQAIEKFGENRKWSDGVTFRASARKVESMDFAKFRNVAHLWGARVAFRWRYGNEVARQRISTRKGQIEFLRYAALFQEFGLTTETPRTTRRKKHTLLDPDTLWRVPTDVRPWSAERLPALSPKMQSILDEYMLY
jgi:hypothetical protein